MFFYPCSTHPFSLMHHLLIELINYQYYHHPHDTPSMIIFIHLQATSPFDMTGEHYLILPPIYFTSNTRNVSWYDVTKGEEMTSHLYSSCDSMRSVDDDSWNDAMVWEPDKSHVTRQKTKKKKVRKKFLSWFWSHQFYSFFLWTSRQYFMWESIILWNKIRRK